MSESGQTHARTDVCQLDSHPITSSCEPSAQVTNKQRRHKRSLPPGFPTRSDTHRAVQTQKMGSGSKLTSKECTSYVRKTKAIISCAVAVQLICAFVFRICRNMFSNGATTLMIYYLLMIEMFLAHKALQ